MEGITSDVLECHCKPSEPLVLLSIVITPNLVDLQAPVVSWVSIASAARAVWLSAKRQNVPHPTNVSRENAMQAVFEMLGEYQDQISLYGLSIAQVMTITDECLQCNIFKWSNEYYRQIRGLAMGQRLAPVLAIAYMSKI
ncbi:unnamed protein product [Heligmosomoides polygyrus]|uniref:Reverse transcriptase domain-containing protein n=1 Tax=Heligmosomoides polygyrus TaxID=6339 RepID=A0A183F4J7_HELPZ|nr:unnamed protein product [Heligmosomoides polygyrus]